MNKTILSLLLLASSAFALEPILEIKCETLPKNSHGIKLGRGKFGKCFIFDGSSGLNHKIKGDKFSDQATVAFWLQIPEYKSAEYRGLINLANHFYIRTSGRTEVNVNVTGWHSLRADTLVPNKWVHVALSFDGKNQVLYLDGKQHSEYSKAMKDIPVQDSISIGMRSMGYEIFRGKMDEIKIFNKALNQKQIENIYKNKKINSTVSI